MPSLTLGFVLAGPAPKSSTITLAYRGFSCAERVEITGAATYAIDLAMMPAAGLKGLVVEVDTTDATGAAVTTPITVRWTSGGVQKEQELSPGGFFALASPSPVNGITALAIVTTAAAVVHVTALG